MGFSNSIATLVLSDNLYQRIAPFAEESFTVISVDGPDMRSDLTVYTALKSVMLDNVYLMSAAQRQAELIRENSSPAVSCIFKTFQR